MMRLPEIVEWLMIYIMDIIFAPEKLEELKKMEYPSKENFVGAGEISDASLEGEICILLSANDPFDGDTIREVRNIIRTALELHSIGWKGTLKVTPLTKIQ